ncbi:MAG: gfo/Idh/MocA family oxidoreductase [Planctomycetota bacterium]|nr:MAG: gfo/Idh/MocA family oxidoreductase [Planctomycetota bacterium]
MISPRVSRRSMVKAIAATAVGAPLIWQRRSALGMDANSRPVFAAIGVGGEGSFARGSKIAQNAAAFADIVAVCDVDRRHAEAFSAKFGNKLRIYNDYRELLDKEKLDLVTIGTPDHWHVPISVAALKAGLHVYCEKPLTLTIEEGQIIGRVVKETGKVFQVGTQQRSEFALRFLQAVVLAKSGRLGKHLHAYVGIGGGPEGGPFPTAQAPEYFDWNMWLGPAPKREYTVERTHKTFRWWLEYSGGKMTDWGAHHIDIAQWALGVDHTGPVEIEGTGNFPSYIPENYDVQAFLAGEIELPNGYNTATTFDITLKYANGATLNVQPSAKGNGGNGILIEGELGRIFVNRGRLSGKPVEDLTEADWKWINEEVVKLYKGKEPGNHMKNFFDCLADGSVPISDVWTHHRTMTSCHMCNLTLLLRRKLRWDPDKEEFIGDEQANALRSRPRRKGFELEV